MAEWDLASSPPHPISLDPSLAFSANVYAFSSKHTKCKQEVEAWDDDQDFVSFEPIFEQLQFQPSGHLPRSPMSDASSNSAADYFQPHTNSASTLLSTPTLPSKSSVSALALPSTSATVSATAYASASTSTSTSASATASAALLSTPPTTPCSQTSPTSPRTNQCHSVSHGVTETHAAQKRAGAHFGDTSSSDSNLKKTMSMLHPSTLFPTTTRVAAPSSSSLSSSLSPPTASLAVTASTTGTASSTSTSTSLPTPPRFNLTSLSVPSVSPAIATATVTATTVLPSLRVHRQNTLTTSTSAGSLFHTDTSSFATNAKPFQSQPITDALPPLAPSSASPAATTTTTISTMVNTTKATNTTRFPGTNTGTGTTSGTDFGHVKAKSSQYQSIPSLLSSPSMSVPASPRPSSSLDREEEDVRSTPPSKRSMTTITQKTIPDDVYSGVITRFNTTRPVPPSADDYEGLVLPDQDILDFNRVRATLEKSVHIPDTLEETDDWDLESDCDGGQSMANSDIDIFTPKDSTPQTDRPLNSCSPKVPSTLHCTPVLSASLSTSASTSSPPPSSPLPGDRQMHDPLSKSGSRIHPRDKVTSPPFTLSPSSSPSTSMSTSMPDRKVSEILFDKDLELPKRFNSFKLTLEPRRRSKAALVSHPETTTQQPQPPPPSSSPATPPSTSLVRNASLKRKDSRIDLGIDARYRDEPEDFWDGLDIDNDQAFYNKSRNKNLVLRPNIQGRARSGSRVQRQVLPLKDFVALPSRIPRLCRAPGDTSRAVPTPPALLRTHSTQFDLPLRNLNSKSSLPRLKRQPSINKRDTTKMQDGADGITNNNGNNNSTNPPSPFVSRATTPIPIQLNTGHRSSWHLGKDELPSFKSSSLALRTVSFSEGTDSFGAVTTATTNSTSSAQSSLSKSAGEFIPKQMHPPSRPSSEQEQEQEREQEQEMEINTMHETPTHLSSYLSSAQHAKSFANLRTMVKKWDWGRPKSGARGYIPSFLSTSSAASDSDTLGSSSQKSTTMMMATEKLLQPNPEVEIMRGHSQNQNLAMNKSETKAPERPPMASRSSSLSDFGLMLGALSGQRDSRPPSRMTVVNMTASQETTQQLSGLDMLDGVSSTGSVGEKVPRRFFLKRSLKHNSFGDGFELEHFDNLPTYQTREESYQLQMQQIAHGRRQSMDRVAAWLRKPQSAANLKENAKIDESPIDQELGGSTKLRKSKSVGRRSLFEIFGQNSNDSSKAKKKKKKMLGGSTLAPIHSQLSVQKFSDPGHGTPSRHMLWSGTDESQERLGGTDHDDVSGGGEEATEPSEDRFSVTGRNKHQDPSKLHYSYLPGTSPWNGSSVAPGTSTAAAAATTASTTTTAAATTIKTAAASALASASAAAAVNRPALIANLSNYSKNRTQVSGKMIFDPVRMCWIFNPEYLAARRRQLQQHQQRSGPILGSKSPIGIVDDIWGDEPDVFAGLSDDESDDESYDVDKHEKDRDSKAHTKDFDEDVAQVQAYGQREEEEVEEKIVEREIELNRKEDAEDPSTEGSVSASAMTTPTATATSTSMATAMWTMDGISNSRHTRLISRPSFSRYSSQEYLKDEEAEVAAEGEERPEVNAQAWNEAMKAPPMTPTSTYGQGDSSRTGSIGVHSIVSKSSRKSLSGHHALSNAASNGILNGGGGGGGSSSHHGFGSNGISSCGEFEVGVEFDITEAFLEQCIAAEAQHRKGAGRFFALPYSPPDEERAPVASSKGVAKMTKLLTFGRKSGQKAVASQRTTGSRTATMSQRFEGFVKKHKKDEGRKKDGNGDENEDDEDDDDDEVMIAKTGFLSWRGTLRRSNRPKSRPGVLQAVAAMEMLGRDTNDDHDTHDDIVSATTIGNGGGSEESSLVGEAIATKTLSLQPNQQQQQQQVHPLQIGQEALSQQGSRRSSVQFGGQESFGPEVIMKHSLSGKMNKKTKKKKKKQKKSPHGSTKESLSRGWSLSFEDMSNANSMHGQCGDKLTRSHGSSSQGLALGYSGRSKKRHSLPFATFSSWQSSLVAATTSTAAGAIAVPPSLLPSPSPSPSPSPVPGPVSSWGVATLALRGRTGSRQKANNVKDMSQSDKRRQSQLYFAQGYEEGERRPLTFSATIAAARKGKYNSVGGTRGTRGVGGGRDRWMTPHVFEPHITLSPSATLSSRRASLNSCGHSHGQKEQETLPRKHRRRRRGGGRLAGIDTDDEEEDDQEDDKENDKEGGKEGDNGATMPVIRKIWSLRKIQSRRKLGLSKGDDGLKSKDNDNDHDSDNDKFKVKEEDKDEGQKHEHKEEEQKEELENDDDDDVFDDEDEYMDRGYRSLSNARGRPPYRPRIELLFEFDTYSTCRFTVK
ncbi:hypothetical protein BGZ94_007146 [Podila epigama]|nr:hypothetical protein BGZ94_007146 [Podila epigama]